LYLRCSSRTGGDARSSAAGKLLKPEFVVVLKPFDRRLKLLISILHLLKLPSEQTNLILQPINPDQKFSGPGLRECNSRARQETAGRNCGKDGTVQHHSHLRSRAESRK